MQGNRGGALADVGPSPRQARAQRDVGALAVGDREAHEPYGLIVAPAIGACDPGQAHADVGAEPLDRPARQRSRDLLRHRAEARDHRRINSRQRDLGFVRVNDRAAEEVRRGARAIGEAGRQHASGARLRDRDRALRE